MNQIIPPPDTSTASTLSDIPDYPDNQISAEQAADLLALQNQALQGEQANEQAQAAQQAQASINQVDELTGIIFAAGNILAVKFPSLGKVYTEERSRTVAKSLNPIFEKLGWNISGGDFAIYLGAIVAVGMLVKDTKDAVLVDLKQQQDEAHEKQMQDAGLRTP